MPATPVAGIFVSGVCAVAEGGERRGVFPCAFPPQMRVEDAGEAESAAATDTHRSQSVHGRRERLKKRLRMLLRRRPNAEKRELCTPDLKTRPIWWPNQGEYGHRKRGGHDETDLANCSDDCREPSFCAGLPEQV